MCNRLAVTEGSVSLGVGVPVLNLGGLVLERPGVDMPSGPGHEVAQSSGNNVAKLMWSFVLRQAETRRD
jgi:hypothetical protein